MSYPNLPLDLCTACGACVSICNRNALRLISDENGFFQPSCDEAKCIGCRQCESVCHVLTANHPQTNCLMVDAFMLKANDKELLKKSSSGGAFSLLANSVLDDGGCVYGAAYDYDNEMLRCFSTLSKSLEELRKSKYVESYMGNTFCDVASNLRDGKSVLFCGTPCQCRGLKSYIRKMRLDDGKLIVARFVCHGVPSNKCLSDYKHWMETKKNSKIIGIDFRPKIKGWRQQFLKFDFENGKSCAVPNICDPYLICFYNSLNLRKSCYKCVFVKEDFCDLTIGDFWGIDAYRPELNDQEGISIVLAHSKKGLNCVNNISNMCSLEPLPSSAIEYLFKENDYSKIKVQRDVFMDQVAQNGFMPVVLKKYGRLIRRNKIRWMWRQIKKRMMFF